MEDEFDNVKYPVNEEVSMVDTKIVQLIRLYLNVKTIIDLFF